MSIINITAKGLENLRNDKLQGDLLLIAEIASRTPNISKRGLQNIFVSLCERYGSSEAAIEALRQGQVLIEKVQ